jgi:GNAT superfamily N-acetyltransferase
VQQRNAGSGAPALIRPATATDAEALRRFLAGLSPRTAYSRFFTGLGHIPDRMLAWLLPRGSDQDVLVAVHRGEIVGHGMYTVARGPEAGAELAVVVADAWQRNGLGPRLIQGLLDRAAGRGIRQVRFTVLAGNLPANRIAMRSWPRARPVIDHGVYEYLVPLAERVAAGPAAA